MKLFKNFRKSITLNSHSETEYEPTEPVIPDKKSDTVPAFSAVAVRETAFLTDEDGNIYSIRNFPFVMGRKALSEGTDLSLSHIPEISGIHAVLTFEKGKYYLEDNRSTNGTFILKDGCEAFSDECRIRKTEIYDGTVFFLYRSRFTFNTDSTSSQTCIVSRQSAFQSSATLPVGSENSEEEYSSDCEAYIISESDELTVMIYSFPFRSDDGLFIIEKNRTGNRFKYYLVSDRNILNEDETVPQGEKSELFSGCHFSADSHRYTFYIK